MRDQSGVAEQTDTGLLTETERLRSIEAQPLQYNCRPSCHDRCSVDKGIPASHIYLVQNLIKHKGRGREGPTCA